MILNIFSCACWPSVCLLWENVYSELLLIFKSECLFFYHYQVIWVLYIFSVLTPYQIYDLQTSFPFSKLSLWVFFYDFLCCAEAFWFDVVPFYFAFVSFAWGDISKKILLRPMLKNMLCFLLGVLCFRSYIQVFNPFWVDFCLWYNIVA